MEKIHMAKPKATKSNPVERLAPDSSERAGAGNSAGCVLDQRQTGAGEGDQPEIERFEPIEWPDNDAKAA